MYINMRIIELTAAIGMSLLSENRFTPDILLTSIDNTSDILHKRKLIIL